MEPSCPDSNPGGDPPPHPCDLASQLRSKAEDECGILLHGMTGIVGTALKLLFIQTIHTCRHGIYEKHYQVVPKSFDNLFCYPIEFSLSTVPVPT